MMQAQYLHLRARRLIAAANELLALARDLEGAASESLCGAFRAPTNPSAVYYDQPYWLELAKREYADRRRRTKFFDAELFGEPAWDILVDLFIATKINKQVSVTSACIGAQVPATTALRWITVLESQGLLTRENDPNDARRAFLRLTSAAYNKLVDYFSFHAPAMADVLPATAA